MFCTGNELKQLAHSINYSGKFPRRNNDLQLLLIEHVQQHESGTESIRGATEIESGVTEDEHREKVRRSYITDGYLSDKTNREMRLNLCLGHLPEKVDKRAWCSLHRWAGSIKKGKDVIRCQVCKVNLCIPCYSLFHTEPDLNEIKNAISDKE